jgi:hypothetical protein
MGRQGEIGRDEKAARRGGFSIGDLYGGYLNAALTRPSEEGTTVAPELV